MPSPVPTPTAPRSSPRFGRSRWLGLALAASLVLGLWWTRPMPQSAPADRGTAAAGAARDGIASAGMPAVTATLAAATGEAAPPFTVPRGTALVHLRLTGDLPPAADLTAEISAAGDGDVKRWPVDDAPVGADGATRVVTVPPYAVAAGRHVLTLWAGDADIVQRYRFTVATP